jgi:DNA polymerase II small subunit
MKKEILDTIRERKLLLEKEIFDLIEGFDDVNVAREFLIGLEEHSGQKMITKALLSKNYEFFRNVVSKTGSGEGSAEKIFVKLGLNLEITKEKEVSAKTDGGQSKKSGFQVFYADTSPYKKLAVEDFVGNFRARYQSLQRILMQRSELQNLTSIGKISGGRQTTSIIGMVTEKRVTKNGNLIIKFEDLTGEISGVVKAGNKEVFAKASELQLDDVVGVRAGGSRDLLFIFDIFFPDAFKLEKTKFEEDMCAAFLSDMHIGSDKHLGRELGKFFDWLNSGDETAKKIKYLFFIGDNVDGVGIFPGQENRIVLKSMEEQYAKLASYFKRVPKNITMFMCPGQHDAIRVAEPQPLISRRYAGSLYEIDNLVLVTNPATIKLIEGDKEIKILMYHGDSLNDFIREIKELREINAYYCPAKAVKHLLKRRHLAPTHSTAIYIPNIDKDPLVISEVPDIMCTGEMHHLDIDSYNGILIVVGSCWQSQTSYEEKIGHVPDPCKVPILNLKTREIKIIDFGEGDEKRKEEKAQVSLIIQGIDSKLINNKTGEVSLIDNKPEEGKIGIGLGETKSIETLKGAMA